MGERLKALHGLSIGYAPHGPMRQVELMLKVLKFGQIIHNALRTVSTQFAYPFEHFPVGTISTWSGILLRTKHEPP
ncbi:hypothetical protein [Bradyrhizobium sp. STM 3561]|uniref:hypothetical protein n=1 Tax=Bradyrhizobium sp. STM 3561 TaxID=578923 RepID=UPI00388EBB95